MKRLSIALSIIFLTAPFASAQDDRDRSQAGLSIAVIPSSKKGGSSFIERDGKFSVLFSNRSEKAIRLWDESCRLGYQTLFFRHSEETGTSTRMCEGHASDWEPLKTITIAPGHTFSWNVTPSGIWGERVWRDVPEPNTGKPVKLIAVYEVESSHTAREHGVWTGRVSSAPVEALVVEPKLRTPHDYLWAYCPKQALRLMQADPNWVNYAVPDRGTPLDLASQLGFIEVVRWLLENGANVNATYHRRTPLHDASDPEVVKLLLAHKADVNAKTSGGIAGPTTALEEAARNYAHLEKLPDAGGERDDWRTITKLLLDAGADYDIRSACYLGDIERVRVLIADKRQARDAHAMQIAATYGRTDIVKLLLAHGAHPYQRFAVRVEAILLPMGATQELRMNTKQPIKKVANHKETVVRLPDGSGDPRRVLIIGLEAGVGWLTLTDVHDKEEKVLVVVEEAASQKPGPSETLRQPAVRVEAILLPEGTTQELRMKTEQPIRKVINEKETVVGVPEAIGDPRRILIKGVGPGIGWLTLTGADGKEERLLIVVEH